jgi:putative endonuclease
MLKPRPGGRKVEEAVMAEQHWIYILELANGSFYTGYTCDLRQRYRLHQAGRGSRYTRSFPPVRIAQSWKLRSGRGTAMKVEAWIKKKGRKTKELLVAHPEKLAALVRDALDLELRVLETAAACPGRSREKAPGPPLAE